MATAAWITLAVLGVGGLIFGLITLSVYLDRRREAAIQAFAESQGYAFDPKAKGARPWRDAGFELFERGSARKAVNGISGAAGDVEIEAFDYRYTTGSGDDTQTHNLAVVGLRVPGAGLPAFSLQREHLGHKIASVFGAKDFDFEAHPDFSKRFHLRGPKEEPVRRLFDAGLIAHFEAMTAKLAVQAKGERLIVFAGKSASKPERYAAFLDEALGLVLELTQRSTRG
ncbi:MAG: hypothetical protein AAF288_11365 [Planctomycetota bacterium]